MPKRNWNDINDSDSSLSSSSEEMEEVPAITKQVSAPPVLAASKLKSACDEMSLRKIDKHQGSEVWLYIPNSYYERCEDADAILHRRPELKKVNRVKNIGWNVLTAKENGKALIQEGFTEEGLFVKFIYSNRNEEKAGNMEDRPKNQKKVTYVEKVTPVAQSEREEKNEKSGVRIQSKYSQPVESTGEKRGQKQKKVKWVQKSKSSKEEDSKTPLSSYEELRSPPKQPHYSPKRWDEAKSPKKINQAAETKSPKRFKQKQPAVDELQDAIKPEPKIQEITPTETECLKEETVEGSSSALMEGEGSSDESIGKQQKKKKRKKKKSKQGKSEKPNPNPYSYFMK